VGQIILIFCTTGLDVLVPPLQAVLILKSYIRLSLSPVTVSVVAIPVKVLNVVYAEADASLYCTV
jgi:hypothetical protein